MTDSFCSRHHGHMFTWRSEWRLVHGVAAVGVAEVLHGHILTAVVFVHVHVAAVTAAIAEDETPSQLCTRIYVCVSVCACVCTSW